MIKKFRQILANPTSAQLKRSHIKQIRRDYLYKKLQRIEQSNMKRYHTSLQMSAVFDWMKDTCFISDEHNKFLLVFWNRVEKVFKKYKMNAIHSHADMPPKLSAMYKLIASAEFSEC